MKIFISYKHEDEARNRWVAELVQDLNQVQGLECLADFMETANTVPDFSQRIGECDLVLVIVTEACRRAIDAGSNYIAYEVSLAIGSSVNGKAQIIPVFREGDEMAYRLSVYPWIDFRDTSAYAQSFRKLLTRIQQKKKTTNASRHDKPLVDAAAVITSWPETATQPGLSAAALAPHVDLEMLYAMWFDAVKTENIEQATRGILEYYKTNAIARQYVNAVVIESLFRLAAERQGHSAYHPLFEKISMLRARIFVRILQRKEAIPDTVCVNLINGFVELLPSTGYAPYIRIINKHLPCSNQYRMFWAGIIAFFFADNTPNEEPDAEYFSLNEFRLNRLAPETAADAEKILRALRNTPGIVRIHTLGTIIGWAVNLRQEPGTSGDFYQQLQQELMQLVEDENPAVSNFALLTIRTLIQIPVGHSDAGRILPDYGYALATRFLHNPDKQIVDELAKTLGTVFQRPYDAREVRNWLRATRNKVFTAQGEKRMLKAPAGLVDKFTALLTFTDTGIIANTYTRTYIAVALLRMGFWVSEMESLLNSMLAGNKEPEALKREIVVRIIKANKDFTVRLLAGILESPAASAELKTLALAGLLETSQVEVVKRLTLKNLPIATDELRAILAEAGKKGMQNLWPGPMAAFLRDKLNSYELMRNAQRIHNIKAKDTTGKWACYFVFVEPEMEALFLRNLNSGRNMNLEDYGRVIASCYGETPTVEVKLFLRERYGFEV